MFKKYLIAVLLGLFINTSAQDFIPENVLAYLQYSNNIRDKFLPVWQTAIKKNGIKKETYVSYDINPFTDQIPLPFDSTTFNYDSDGKLMSVVYTSPFPGAENAVRLTTAYNYEAGLLTGAKEGEVNSLVIKRDGLGKITNLQFGENEDKVNYDYKYANGQLIEVAIRFGEDQSVKISYEDGKYIAKDSVSLMSTSGDKYGRINNVYSHNVGLDNLYDSSERLVEMKLYQGGTTEITSFLYENELLKEIIFNNHEGEIGAEQKDTKITKTVRTVVRYDK
ncbi:MAG: hypothetical protein LCH52_09775 [Bacteroidetes bacterium]|nr:hypothetical protein [Bacteroidota bacterium]